PLLVPDPAMLLEQRGQRGAARQPARPDSECALDRAPAIAQRQALRLRPPRRPSARDAMMLIDPPQDHLNPQPGPGQTPSARATRPTTRLIKLFIATPRTERVVHPVVTHPVAPSIRKRALPVWSSIAPSLRWAARATGPSDSIIAAVGCFLHPPRSIFLP